MGLAKRLVMGASAVVLGLTAVAGCSKSNREASEQKSYGFYGQVIAREDTSPPSFVLRSYSYEDGSARDARFVLDYTDPNILIPDQRRAINKALDEKGIEKGENVLVRSDYQIRTRDPKNGLQDDTNYTSTDKVETVKIDYNHK